MRASGFCSRTARWTRRASQLWSASGKALRSRSRIKSASSASSLPSRVAKPAKASTMRPRIRAPEDPERRRCFQRASKPRGRMRDSGVSSWGASRSIPAMNGKAGFPGQERRKKLGFLSPDEDYPAVPFAGHPGDAIIRQVSAGAPTKNQCQNRPKIVRRRAQARADPMTRPDSTGVSPFCSVWPSSSSLSRFSPRR